MKATRIPTTKGDIRLIENLETPVHNSATLLELYLRSPSDTLVLSKVDIIEEFFDLSSGIAGEMLQMLSNYRKRLVVLGDFSTYSSTSLRDFIRESNRTGRVIFTDTVGHAIPQLK